MKYDQLDSQEMKAALLPLVSRMSGENTPREQDTLDTLSITNYKSESNGCLGKTKGLLFMMLSVFFLDLARFLIKLAYQTSADLSANQQTFGKFAAMLVLMVFIMVSSMQCKDVLCSIPHHIRCKFLTRCFLFTAVSVFQSYGIKMLTYSTAVIISFIAPLLVPFSAFLILRERITFCNVLSLVICFIGVLIFVNPGFFPEQQNPNDDASQTNSIAGIGLMLLSAVARSFDITYMRLINKAKNVDDKHSGSRQFLVEVDQDGHCNYTQLQFDLSSGSLNQLSVVFYLSVIGSIVSGICLGVQQGIAPSQEIALVQIPIIALLFGSAALLVLSQIMYSLATKSEDVSKLAAMYYFQIIMAFVWESTVFHGKIGASEIIGTAIILITSGSVALLRAIQ